jgi:hypothetical protein
LVLPNPSNWNLPGHFPPVDFDLIRIHEHMVSRLAGVEFIGAGRPTSNILLGFHPIKPP